MVLQLIRNKDGNYEYKDAMETSAPNITSSEFESYTGDTKTTLAGGTDLGTQTATLMRETPGETELITDPVTGETRTQSKIQPVSIQQQQFAPPSAQDLVESPLQKAARLAQQFPMQQQTGPSPQEFLGQIQSMQDKALKADRINTLLRGGVDLGISYLRGPTPLNIQQTVTPLTRLTATEIGASTVGGVGMAGAAGYGISRALGGDKKESTAAGAGAAIGTAVGGPVGGVVGGVIGKVVGGRVICNELCRQGLLSKEDVILDLKFTKDYLTNTKNITVACYEKCFEVANEKCIFLINSQSFNSLTPVRLQKWKIMGWEITDILIINIPKWYGRYYVITFEKGKQGILKWIK